MADDIDVTFIDASTNEELGRVEVPATRLPETFELATTLHFGELEWSVVSANPATRTAYEQTKKLVLRVQKIDRVDPKSILFSIPTIETAIPPADGDPVTGDELVVHEDD